jgi:hypothetical protein
VGCAAVLRKPFDVATLAGVVAQAFARAGAPSTLSG